jgi:protein-S-isoprenylcysteine O-methyltransferase Ste14
MIAAMQGYADLTIRHGNFLFRYRNLLFPVVLVALALAFPPRPGAWIGLGMALAILGQAIRAAVIGLAYIKRGGINKRIAADRLVTDGLFGHCRNPLYLGNLLILFGLFVVYHSPWVYLFGVPYFAYAYHSIVAAEECYLQDKFGADYQDYVRRVPRWWPRLTGLSQTWRSMTFNWRRVIAKDYASAYTWLLIALAILAYKGYLEAPGNAALISAAAAIGLIALTAAFLYAKFLKRAGRLA